MQGKPYELSCLRSTARLLIMGNGCTRIGAILHIDRCKVANIKYQLEENDIKSIEQLNSISDEELAHIIYPSCVLITDENTGKLSISVLKRKNSNLLHPNFKALAQKKIEEHCQITELYYAYQDICDREKKQALCRCSFFAGVKKFINEITRGEDACLTLQHEYGQDIQVDYIDKYPTLTLGDGTKQNFVVFVMVWPASYYTYACFIPNHSTIQTCHAIGSGIKYFGARSYRLCPDNAKSMVTSHKKGREAILNASFEDFMRRLGIDVQPTTTYSASSKSAVEYENRLIEERVFPHLEKDTRRTLQEWNAWLMELINSKINRTKLHRTGKTREQLFLEYEKPAARSLDFAIPEFQEVQRCIRVPRTYLVEFYKHRYSVDHRLIGELVDIRATATIVRIYYQNKLIATYPRKQDQGVTILPEHMPENHRAVVRKDDKYNTEEEVIEAASSLSVALLTYCKHRLNFNDTQRFVACTSTIRHYRKALNKEFFDKVLLKYSKEDDRYKCDSSRILKDVNLELQRIALDSDCEKSTTQNLPSSSSENSRIVKPIFSNSLGAFSSRSATEQAKVDACVFTDTKSYSAKQDENTASAHDFDDELPF